MTVAKAVVANMPKRRNRPLYPVIVGLRDCIGRSYLNRLWSNRRAAGGGAGVRSLGLYTKP